MKKPRRKRPERRNPEARELALNPLYRQRIVPAAKERPAKDEEWSRGAKHKSSRPDGE